MNLWDQLTGEYDPKSPFRKFWTKPSVWIEMFESALSGCRTVLDVGCGAGFLAIPLAKEFKVYGLDLSKEMLNLAELRAREFNVSISLVQADSQILPFEDDFFDAAYCKFALWPLKQPEKALKEMVRVVRPGGRVVIVEVDRGKRYDDYKVSLKSKIFYSLYRVFKYILTGRKDTRKIWKRLMEETKANPTVNLNMVKNHLERYSCRTVTVDRQIKKRTSTFLSKMINSDPDYFLIIAEKEGKANE